MRPSSVLSGELSGRFPSFSPPLALRSSARFSPSSLTSSMTSALIPAVTSVAAERSRRGYPLRTMLRAGRTLLRGDDTLTGRLPLPLPLLSPLPLPLPQPLWPKGGGEERRPELVHLSSASEAELSNDSWLAMLLLSESVDGKRGGARRCRSSDARLAAPGKEEEEEEEEEEEDDDDGGGGNDDDDDDDGGGKG
jgi:hypothetical protein